MSNVHQVTILLVEDDPGHARLIEKNLRRSNIANQIIHVSDGQQAIDYLFGDECPSSLLVLLDLNMPVLDGYQVLERLKADAVLQKASLQLALFSCSIPFDLQQG